MTAITLQLTQQCNFRCAYCIYSDISNENQREHSSKRMPFDTAKRSIDFLIEHSCNLDTVNIGFYGGEPLLEMDLIINIIDYVESVSEGKKVTYSMTTNGSLLTDQIVEYCISKNIKVTISIDGNKEIHDKNRRFKKDGCGTFHVIMNNLTHIVQAYPEFKKMISLSMVMDPQDDIECSKQLFYDYEFLNDIAANSSFIDDFYSTEKVYFNKSLVLFAAVCVLDTSTLVESELFPTELTIAAMIITTMTQTTMMPTASALAPIIPRTTVMIMSSSIVAEHPFIIPEPSFEKRYSR